MFYSLISFFFWETGTTYTLTELICWPEVIFHSKMWLALTNSSRGLGGSDIGSPQAQLWQFQMSLCPQTSVSAFEAQVSPAVAAGM